MFYIQESTGRYCVSSEITCIYGRLYTPVGVLEADARAADGAGDGDHGLLLPNDLLM